jgi:hypothetical protein
MYVNKNLLLQSVHILNTRYLHFKRENAEPLSLGSTESLETCPAWLAVPAARLSPA